MLTNMSNLSKVIMGENLLDCETSVDEAYNLLQNGILVETSKGVVCMSLNDALASDLNLSVDVLKNVASELISQQNVPKPDKVYLKTSTLNFDSDGFSSECSDVSFSSSASLQSNFITLKNIPLIKTDSIKEPKTITFLPCSIDLKHNQPDTSAIQNHEPPAPTEGTLVVGPQVSAAPIDEVHKPPKRRGGWPKGRKRKPELLNLPPKAPATGYNLYLNEQRKLFKDSNLVFHEITKVIGNKWSNLSLEEKQPYLARAEEDKRRYREELKQYRQSDAYRAYLAKKRRNKMQNNVFSESDMDATDEIDEEDNEELYCRTCDQWFHNLHNKREHLQGRQHTQSVAGAIRRELDTDHASSSENGLFTASLDESSLDAFPHLAVKKKGAANNASVPDCMSNLVLMVTRREREIKTLQNRLQETSNTHSDLCKQLSALRQKHAALKTDLCSLKEHEQEMEAKVSQLWQVPSWFIVTDFNVEPTVGVIESSGTD